MDAPGVVLMVVLLLWGGCLVSMVLHVKMDVGEEDPGRVTPGIQRRLRGIEGGRR